MPDNEEYSSYTLPTEDAAAQEAHTIPLEDAAAQESRTIPLEDERTQGAQDSAAQPAKKKSPLPWIIGGAAVTPSFSDEIGADGYSKDAADCVKLVSRLLS